jgi:hypothetical protein
MASFYHVGCGYDRPPKPGILNFEYEDECEDEDDIEALLTSNL